MYRLGTYSEQRQIAERKRAYVKAAKLDQMAVEPKPPVLRDKQKSQNRSMQMLVTVIHQCLHQGMYDLAYQGWGLLVRTAGFNLANLWELGYEILVANGKDQEAIGYLYELLSTAQITPRARNRKYIRPMILKLYCMIIELRIKLKQFEQVAEDLEQKYQLPPYNNAPQIYFYGAMVKQCMADALCEDETDLSEESDKRVKILRTRAQDLQERGRELMQEHLVEEKAALARKKVDYENGLYANGLNAEAYDQEQEEEEEVEEEDEDEEETGDEN